MAEVRLTDAEGLSGRDIGSVVQVEVEPNVIVQDVLEGVSHEHAEGANVLLRFEKVRPNRQDYGYVGSGSFMVGRDVPVMVVRPRPDAAELELLRQKLQGTE